MHPATLLGIGVINKLYFAIFAAFKESMTLNLAQPQRSFKVIYLGGDIAGFIRPSQLCE